METTVIRNAFSSLGSYDMCGERVTGSTAGGVVFKCYDWMFCKTPFLPYFDASLNQLCMRFFLIIFLHKMQIMASVQTSNIH